MLRQVSARQFRISIHAAREGGDLVVFAREPMIDISIHAAREGGDGRKGDETVPSKYISIHAAREGGDPFCGRRPRADTHFNPRRP